MVVLNSRKYCLINEICGIFSCQSVTKTRKRGYRNGVEIAVILSLTCSNDRIHYLDLLGACDMNTISVGTVSWCSYHEI